MSETTPECWEYFHQEQFQDAELNIAKLNMLGRLGWEVIYVGRLSYLLKRRIGDQHGVANHYPLKIGA